MEILPIAFIVVLILVSIFILTQNVFGTKVKDVVEHVKVNPATKQHPLGEAVVVDVLYVPLERPVFICYSIKLSAASTLYKYKGGRIEPIAIIIDDDPATRFQLIGQPQIVGDFFFLPIRVFNTEPYVDEPEWIEDRFVAASLASLNSDKWQLKTIALFEEAKPVENPPVNKPAVACVIDKSLGLRSDYILFFPSTSQFMFVTAPAVLRANESSGERDISCWYSESSYALVVHRMRCQEPVIIDVTSNKPLMSGWQCIPADKHPPPPPPKDNENNRLMLLTGSTGCSFGPARTRSQMLTKDLILYYGYDFFVLADLKSKTITDCVRLPANVNPNERRYFDTAGYDPVTQIFFAYSPWRREWLQLPLYINRCMFGRDISWFKGPSPWSHAFVEPQSNRLCTITYPNANRLQLMSEVQGPPESGLEDVLD